MSDGPPIGTTALVTGIGIVVVVVGMMVGGGALFVRYLRVAKRLSEERTEELTRYAASRRLQRVPAATALPPHLAGPPFPAGGMVTPALAGTHAGRPVLVFDFVFVTHQGDRSVHHRFSAVATALPVLLPALSVVVHDPPEASFVAPGARHRSGDPRFEAVYDVVTDSPGFAADVLTPDLRAWLLGRKPVGLYVRGADLVVVDADRLSRVTAERMLEFSAAFLARLPPRLWGDGRTADG